MATSLVYSSSLIRSQIFKLTSSQGEQALLRPPALAGHCQTEEPSQRSCKKVAWGGFALYLCLFLGSKQE